MLPTPQWEAMTRPHCISYLVLFIINSPALSRWSSPLKFPFMQNLSLINLKSKVRFWIVGLPNEVQHYLVVGIKSSPVWLQHESNLISNFIIHPYIAPRRYFSYLFVHSSIHPSIHSFIYPSTIHPHSLGTHPVPVTVLLPGSLPLLLSLAHEGGVSLAHIPQHTVLAPFIVIALNHSFPCITFFHKLGAPFR